MSAALADYQSISQTLASQGFVILRGFLDQAELTRLEQACEPIINEYGVRQVLQIHPDIALSLPWQKILSVLGAAGISAAKPVRSLYFNKNAAHNWLVPWHQDMTICVNQKAELAGYGKWTQKNGVHHVEPPAEVLEQMLTMRIAMDAANHENAALKVLAGSHRHGKLKGTQLDAYIEKTPDVDMHICTMQTGDVLLMKPLLLHASDKAIEASQRRVLHLEFSAATLPDPIQWAEAAQISGTTN